MHAQGCDTKRLTRSMSQHTESAAKHWRQQCPECPELRAPHRAAPNPSSSPLAAPSSMLDERSRSTATDHLYNQANPPRAAGC